MKITAKAEILIISAALYLIFTFYTGRLVSELTLVLK